RPAEVHRQLGRAHRGPAGVDNRRRRPDHRVGGRRDDRHRHLRGAARGQRHLRRDRAVADRREGRGGGVSTNGAGPAANGNGNGNGRRPKKEKEALRPSDFGSSGPQARWGAMGMPLEKSRNFGASIRRLLGMLGPQWVTLIFVLTTAIAAATLNVFGPKVLGSATDVIFKGVFLGGGSINFGKLHHILFIAVGLYLSAWLLSLSASYMIAGLVQTLMWRLRAMAEAKINALPLSYIDHHARGDLLSRVTNDIDNVAQSLQQTLSNTLT